MEINIGDRVIWTRNGYDGSGIVYEIDGNTLQIAVIVPLSSPQSYAVLKITEVTPKPF